MEAIKNWFAQASMRDQLALVIGGFGVLAYVLWMAVLTPAKTARDEQMSRNQSSLQALERVRVLAGQWKNRQQGNSHQRSSGNIVKLVDRSLQQNGLRMSGMQPSGSGDVRLRFEKVDYQGLLKWLYEMEVTQGLQVRDISVAASSDPGKVVVNLRLRKG